MEHTQPVLPAMPECMPAELLASTSFLLARIGFAIKAAAFETYEQTGFSPYHYSILALLDEGARTTQGAIADALQFDRSQLVGLLDVLEDRGLIERRRDAVDRRRHVVTLTSAGQKQLAEFRTITQNIESEFLAPLDADSRTTLHGLLSKLAVHYDPRFAGQQSSAPAIS